MARKGRSVGRVIAVGAIVTGLGVAIASTVNLGPPPPLSVAIGQSTYRVGDNATFATTGLTPPITLSITVVSGVPPYTQMTTVVVLAPPSLTTSGGFVVGSNLIGSDYLTAVDGMGKSAQSGYFVVTQF